MRHYDVRDRLIDRTITVIAENGMDKTTTKAIVKGTDINEAYIYQYFSSKEELLIKTFDKLDDELVAITMQYVKLMYMQELEWELRCRMFFTAVWGFLMGNREKCLAFVRYYYSPYFQEYSYETHKQRYASLVKEFEAAFKEEADVWMILNHILNVMLDFAVKAHSGQMPANDDYVEHVFRVVYVSVKQYFHE